MKLLFICGSLEPGKDGVGDYTRRLAGELIRKGHSIKIIALYDRKVEKISLDLQNDEHTTITVMRLPVILPDKIRFRKVEEFINREDPEWLSLQFVPFSFHKKGLPLKLANQLNKLGRGKSWHVMFHELWVEGNNFNSTVLSILQKKIISNIIKKINPIVIHTHVPVYLDRLKKLHSSIEPLPIFSNIISLNEEKKRERKVFTIGFFSQFKSPDEVFSFLKTFTNDLLTQKITIKFLLIGGCSKEKNLLRSRLLKTQPCKVEIITTGFLDIIEVAKFIKICDLGITPVPRHLLGKSGSVVAFLSNGTPVAAPYIKPPYNNCNFGFFDKDLCSTIVASPNLINVQQSAAAARNAANKLNISQVTQKFINDLYVKTKPPVNQLVNTK